MAPLISLLLFSNNVCLVSVSLFNAALYKPAYISSVFSIYGFPLSANLANDGSDDTNVYGMQCTHSNMENPGWWMVDLRGLYSVEKIILTNRGDQYDPSQRTKNYQFDVFKTDPRLSPNFPMASGEVCYTRTDPLGQGEMFTQNCTTPIMGRFVRFIRYTSDYINFCEVKVMVSYAAHLDNKFSMFKNSALQAAPYLTTTTTSALACTLMCLQRRDSDTCTAVNWVRSTKQCQMLKVDPRISVLLSDQADTYFYIEE